MGVPRDPPPVGSSARRLRRAAGLTSLGSAIALVALWWVFIRTDLGRFLDDLVKHSNDVTDPDVIGRRYSSLQLITTASLAIGCTGLLVVGVLRRRPLLGVATALVAGLSAVTTEFLKHGVIKRPVDLPDGAGFTDNTFPSGHATVSTALALAALMVTPRRWRLPVAITGSLWVVFQGTGVVLTGWHRPSDVFAGYAVALGWAAAAVWGLGVADHVDSAEVVVGAERGARWTLVVLAVAMGGLGASVLVGGDSPFTWRGLNYVAASASITVVGVGVVAGFTWLLRGWSLGRPPHDVAHPSRSRSVSSPPPT